MDKLVLELATTSCLEVDAKRGGGFVVEVRSLLILADKSFFTKGVDKGGELAVKCSYNVLAVACWAC